MRLKSYFVSAFFISSTVYFGNAWAAHPASFNALDSGVNDSIARIQTIDAADTIFFDLANGVINGGTVDIPVFFKSDDTINAVDFAFRFNQPHLLFDTIYTTLSSLSENYYLNPADSTLRFTSFSIPVLSNNVNFAWIRFSVNMLPVLAADFNSVEGYLNGYACSYRFTDGATMSVSEINHSELKCYPNPSNDRLMIEGYEAGSTFEIIDTQGRMLTLEKYLVSNSGCLFDVSGLTAGSYYLRNSSAGKSETTKIVVCH